MSEHTPITPPRSRGNFCYVLWNGGDGGGGGGKTYNGYTNDLTRRLRQHNGEIKGGARSTTRAVASGDRPWEYLAVVRAAKTQEEEYDFTKREALSLEWHIRYPTCKRPRPSSFRGPEGRLRSLALATVWFLRTKREIPMEVFVHPAFLSRARELLAERGVGDRVTVVALEKDSLPL